MKKLNIVRRVDVRVDRPDPFPERPVWKPKRRQQCPTAPRALDLAEPPDAQFVMASLVSSGTTRGKPPFVPRGASIASELAGQVTPIGWAGSKSPYAGRQASQCCPVAISQRVELRMHHERKIRRPLNGLHGPMGLWPFDSRVLAGD